MPRERPTVGKVIRVNFTSVNEQCAEWLLRKVIQPDANLLPFEKGVKMYGLSPVFCQLTLVCRSSSNMFDILLFAFCTALLDLPVYFGIGSL